VEVLYWVEETWTVVELFVVVWRGCDEHLGEMEGEVDNRKCIVWSMGQ
jgi:hypothetical protein